ncbi:MAG TPA: acyltransferase [Bryobacteraceae bacterium]|nr:acyltransferase [Bryobacteraceae bacterium]
MDAKKAESRNLDLLRAFAVLCVFFSHMILCCIPGHHVDDAVQTPVVAFWYGVGDVGVLMFFVHTSLVLLYSLERNGGSFLNFYIRRFFRIYPLSTACIALVLLFHVPYVPEMSFAAPAWSAVVSNLLLIQNLTYAKDLISPLWTLPREVQMYLALPFIFVLLRRMGSAPVVLLLWWAAGVAAPHYPVLTCVPCFFGGVLAYQIGREKTYAMAARWWPAALLALVAVHLAVRLTLVPDYRPDYVLCVAVGALIPNFRDLASSWLTRACHVVAKYSYGIYLFHLPILWLALFKLAFLPVALRWLALAVLMTVVPWAMYRWLEAPLIETGRRLATRVKIPARRVAGAENLGPVSSAEL